MLDRLAFVAEMYAAQKLVDGQLAGACSTAPDSGKVVHIVGRRSSYIYQLED